MTLYQYAALLGTGWLAAIVLIVTLFWGVSERREGNRRLMGALRAKGRR